MSPAPESIIFIALIISSIAIAIRAAGPKDFFKLSPNALAPSAKTLNCPFMPENWAFFLLKLPTSSLSWDNILERSVCSSFKESNNNCFCCTSSLDRLPEAISSFNCFCCSRFLTKFSSSFFIFVVKSASFSLSLTI